MENQSYIKHVHLQGYKSIKNLEADFLPGLNIIIGDNGSGKSNFFKFIESSFKTSFDTYSPFYSKILYFENNEKLNIELKARPYQKIKDLVKKPMKVVIGSSTEYEILQTAKKNVVEIVAFSIPNKLYLLADELSLSYFPGSIFANFNFVYQNNFPLFFQDAFCQVLPIIFQQKKSKTEKEIYEVINTFLNEFYQSFFESTNQFTNIRQIKLSENLRVVNGNNGLIEIRNITFEYLVDTNWVGWNALSDGTRRLLYAIFLVCGFELKDENPPIILFEEPEVGIHPHQLHLLLQFLKERSKTQQIIISTHSPQVLDIIGSNELDKITIAEIDNKAGTTFRKLNKKEISKAKTYLKETGFLSDYWRFSDFQRTKKY